MVRSFFILHLLGVLAWFVVAFVHRGPDAWQSSTLFIAAVALFGTALSGLHQSDMWGEVIRDPRAPAWLQAGAAVLAIAFAVGYPEYRQSVGAREVDITNRTALMGKIDGARWLVIEINSSIDLASKNSVDGRPLGIGKARIDDWLARFRHYEEVLPRNTNVMLMEARLAMEPLFLFVHDASVHHLNREQVALIQRVLGDLQIRLHAQVGDVADGYPPMTGEQRGWQGQIDEWIAKGLYRGPPRPERQKLKRPGNEMGLY